MRFYPVISRSIVYELNPELSQLYNLLGLIYNKFLVCHSFSPEQQHFLFSKLDLINGFSVSTFRAISWKLMKCYCEFKNSVTGYYVSLTIPSSQIPLQP